MPHPSRLDYEQASKIYLIINLQVIEIFHKKDYNQGDIIFN
jgi:hypothetical protein